MPPGPTRLLPQVFAGLLVGAMLPYWFSAMTMKSVGKVSAAHFDPVRVMRIWVCNCVAGCFSPCLLRWVGKVGEAI